MTQAPPGAGTRAVSWPVKQYDVRNHSQDSTRWNSFRFRPGDIVVASWAKTGTTWIQQILGQLIFSGAEGLPVVDLCPWIEQRYPPIEALLERAESQTHRRFVKTHLPVHALPFSPIAKYLYVGRDGRDALWSWYRHNCQLTPHALNLLNSVPDRVGPPLERPRADVRRFFHEWLDGDGYPIWPFWSNVQSWWNVRHLPNVLFVHFNNLKRDLETQIHRIARFLEIEVPNELWPVIVEHSTFEYMKAHASSLSPMLARGFEKGAEDFIYRGTNGRWRDVLTAADLHKYETHAARNLTPSCRHWLATGEVTGDLADPASEPLYGAALASS